MYLFRYAAARTKSLTYLLLLGLNLKMIPKMAIVVRKQVFVWDGYVTLPALKIDFKAFWYN